MMVWLLITHITVKNLSLTFLIIFVNKSKAAGEISNIIYSFAQEKNV
jgi:hypothetical protein